MGDPNSRDFSGVYKEGVHANKRGVFGYAFCWVVFVSMLVGQGFRWVVFVSMLVGQGFRRVVYVDVMLGQLF